MIRFDKVSKVYSGGHQALQKVSFHLRKGEMAFLTGHSGAGKSTLMKMIMLMEQPSLGQVFVDGYHLETMPKSQIPYFRRNIGVVFQNHQLLFDRTVYDNVALPLQVAGYPRRVDMDIAWSRRRALGPAGQWLVQRLLGKQADT